jgi:hypothetical protein
MSNPFAALADTAAPERDQQLARKPKREKDRHDPGSGRRDKTKRDDRGGLAWGNPIDIQKRPSLVESNDDPEQSPSPDAAEEADTPKIEYTSAVGVFAGDSDDDEDLLLGVPQKAQKPVAVIPEGFQKLIGNRPLGASEIRTKAEPDEPQFEVGFLSTQEAFKQQAERAEQRGRGRGGFGGRGRGRGGGPPRRDDWRGERGGGRGGRGGRRDDDRPRRDDDRPRREDDRPARPPPPPREGGDEERPSTSRGRRPPREARPVAPQHQRQAAGGGRQHLSLNDFPSFH